MALKKKGNLSGIPVGLGMGLLTGIIVTLVGSMVIASLIAAEKMEMRQMFYGVAVVVLLSAFVGSLAAAALAGEKRLLICAISGCVYFVTMLCVSALVFDGIYENVWSTGLLILAGSMAAGFVGIRRKNSHYRGRMKRAGI
jgi:putative membrane protein (TIGR04086 family)